MFAHKIPQYQKGRILSREILSTMRDLSYDFSFLPYKSLTDGIILPCKIEIQELDNTQRLIISGGLIKYRNRLYKTVTPAAIPYEHTGGMNYLQIRFLEKTDAIDFLLYETEFVLSTESKLEPNEIELARFKLQSGNRLRDDYTGFEDLATEYDTLNVTHALYAGMELPTISPYITRLFAKEAYSLTAGMAFDNNFCCHCLNHGQPIERFLIEQYIRTRLKLGDNLLTNEEIYRNLKIILRDIKKGIAVDGYREKKRGSQIKVGF